MSGKARLHKLPTKVVKWHQPAPPKPAPAWKPYVHPEDRGFIVITAGKPLADALVRFGVRAEMAALRGRLTEAAIYWIPAEAQETAEMLTIINTALRITYTAAAPILAMLREAPGWEDTASELRACHRLGADGAALRSILDVAIQALKGNP